MTPRYSHTQIGWVIIAIILAAIAIIAFVLVFHEFQWIPLITALAL